MLKTKKLLNYLILSVAIFTIFTSANAATKTFPSQEVYLAEQPLPIIAKDLREQGMSDDEISDHLKATLTKITPELAKEKFGIEWVDNKLKYEYVKDRPRAGSYPAVAICYMGPEVGHGLFAMEKIVENQIIAEYTGKHIKNKKDYVKNEYIAELSLKEIDKNDFEKMDAEKQGNAARFAQHIISGEELANFNYEAHGKPILETYDVAIPNCGLAVLGTFTDRHLGLFATKDIAAFEQIGFSYSDDYGYPNSMHPNEPCPFAKDGTIIHSNQYNISNQIIMLGDGSISNMFLRFNKNDFLLFTFNKINDYDIIEYNDDIVVVVKESALTEEISKTGHRLYVPCYIVTSNTDLEKFIETINLVSDSSISEETKIEALKAAKENQFKKVEVILELYKKDGTVIQTSVQWLALNDEILQKKVAQIDTDYLLEAYIEEINGYSVFVIPYEQGSLKMIINKSELLHAVAKTDINVDISCYLLKPKTHTNNFIKLLNYINNNKNKINEKTKKWALKEANLNHFAMIKQHLESLGKPKPDFKDEL